MQEQILKARYYAACDIAHRWFAYFEGTTENVTQHSDIFSEDIMLVHAGTHLLAQGKGSMIEWLNGLPHEKGSHSIRQIKVLPVTEDTANVMMNISYQAVREDGTTGGALSEYETSVTYDKDHNAVFTFIQKTPRFPNPETVFRDSFGENRMNSFIARLCQLMLTAAPDISDRLLHPDANPETVLSLHMAMSLTDIYDVSADHTDVLQLTCKLKIQAAGASYSLALELNESAGRYLTIRRAALYRET